MKKIFFLIGVLLWLCSCGNNNAQLLELENVCDAIDDSAFALYCYARYDVNKDNRVSQEEANNVKSMNLRILSRQIESLKGIEYFSNLTYINCYECEKLEYVDLSKNLHMTSIDGAAFAGCERLKTVILPPNLTKIDDDAFYDCISLKNIMIPKNVKTINEGAFEDCINMEYVYCKSANPPQLDAYENEFPIENEKFRIYVPLMSIMKYKKDKSWKAYEDKINIKLF